MMAAGRPEFEREAESGSYALETLLEQQVDKAFDKFTAYALRNIFAVPDGVELVMVSGSGRTRRGERCDHSTSSRSARVIAGRISKLYSVVDEADASHGTKG